MKSKIDELLDVLLVEIRQGKSIEDCLKAYPEYCEELKPLLYLAKEIEDLPKLEPDSAAVEETLRKVRTTVRAQQPKQRFSPKRIFALRPAFVRAVVVAILLIVAGWTTVSLSAKSLPGDVLYPVKRLCEKIQYSLTVTPEGKTELHLIFADRRSTEFIITFREGEQINRELLNALLDEKKRALKCSESLFDQGCIKMLEKIRECNCGQMEMLERIKPLVIDSDTMFINEAITSCTECECCIERRLNQASTKQ